MKIRRVILLAAAAAYFLFHVHPRAQAETNGSPSEKAKPTGKQNADQLLGEASKALAYTVKSARAAGKELSPENPSAKPFLLSLQKISKALDEAEKALDAKDPAFFKAISHAQAGVAEMQVTWDLTQSSDANVIKGGKALGGAVSALHSEYGPMAQRKSKGGGLTAEESKTFQDIKAGQPDFRKKIHRLISKYKNDPALVQGLRKLSRRSMEIEKAPNTLEAYAGTIDLISTLSGLLHGYSYYLPPDARKAWSGLSKSSGFKQSYYYAPVAGYNWSYVESSVEVYDSYELSVTSEEISSEESYIEESSFEMSEEESSEVAEESDEISAEEANDEEMESEQEEVDEAEDAEEMNVEEDGADEAADAEDDAAADSGDDGGSDDGGGDDGGGSDEGGSDDSGGDE